MPVVSPSLVQLPIPRLHCTSYLVIPVWPVPVLLGAVQLEVLALRLALMPVGVPGAESAASEGACVHAMPVARRRMT